LANPPPLPNKTIYFLSLFQSVKQILTNPLSSHPTSPNYGKHWTKEAVHDMFAPSEETVETVREWLVASGIEISHIVHSDNKGWLAFDIPTWQAEELFQTKYHEHVHVETGAVKVGSDEYENLLPNWSCICLILFLRYYLPEHVREHVDYISPGVKLSAPMRKAEIKRSSKARNFHKPGPWKQPHNPHFQWTPPPGASGLPEDLKACSLNMTPTCLRALYGIPVATIKDDVNMLGLYESGDSFSQPDLDLTFAEYAPWVPQGTHPLLDSIDGGVAPVAPDSDENGGESDIDMVIGFSLIHVRSLSFSLLKSAMLTCQAPNNHAISSR
jgi:tripeptidyl-peptidase-1